MRPKALVSWSSGKDSAWMLHHARQSNQFDIVGLVTTINEEFSRVAMHGVRHELVERQAKVAALPLWTVPLPWPCSNELYEAAMKRLIEDALRSGVTHFLFGDLYLNDVRAYRERLLADTGIEPVFPLWGEPSDTPSLARRMIDAGLRATLSCVDPKQLPAEFVGREFDDELLADLPKGVDPCGENGEFHTFCHSGPMFSEPVAVTRGETVDRDGFRFADLLPSG